MNNSENFTAPVGTPPNPIKFPIDRDGFINFDGPDDLVIEIFDANLRGQAQAGTPLNTIRGWPVYKGSQVRLLVRNKGTVPHGYRVWFTESAAAGGTGR